MKNTLYFYPDMGLNEKEYQLLPQKDRTAYIPQSTVDELVEAAKTSLMNIKILGRELIELRNEKARQGIHSNALTSLRGIEINNMVEKLEQALSKFSEDVE